MIVPERPLHDLVPDVYRLRDVAKGLPLEALLQVLQEQVEVVEADIAGLYDNWFVETCADWVVPYIGDLVGWRPLAETGLDPRREVANTIRFRRRRGTLKVLEQLATDLTGWPARAVEFFRLLAVAQDVGGPRPARGRRVDLHDGPALGRAGTSFEELARTVDVREATSPRGLGRHNLPSIGLSVWRLRAYPVTRAQAYCREDVAPHCFTFSALGNDSQLFNRPRAAAGDTVEEGSLPGPVRRDVRPEDHYGTYRSFEVELRRGGRIPREQVVFTDLSTWDKEPPRDRQVAIDPVLGRILFSSRESPPPRDGVRVSYRYGAPADLGGGEYDRPLPELTGAWHRLVRGEAELRHAIERWREERPALAVIELGDSQVYTLSRRRHFELPLRERQVLHLRAANRTRPVLRLLDLGPDRPDALRFRAAKGSRLVFDGLLLAGRPLRVEGPMEELVIRHATLVPGWDLEPDCRPTDPAEPSLELVGGPARVVVEHSIVGSVQVDQDPGDAPLRLEIAETVLDATGRGREALGAPGQRPAHVDLDLTRTTVIGTVEVHALGLAENSILDGRVRVSRHQRGCVRFCYVQPGSRTPRRHHCQPDLATAGLSAAAAREVARWLRPAYDSIRYGTPDYVRLSVACPPEIAAGADDASEPGVYHDLFQPQRLTALRTRIEEYTPAAMQTGIFLAT